MSILESLCRLVGELEDEKGPRQITLKLHRDGLEVLGTRNQTFMTYECRILIPRINLDYSHDPEGIIVDTIRRVRESLTFPEDRS